MPAPETILVADDAPSNLSILSATLEPRGYNILAAPNGEVAIKLATRALPDLILLDVMMPDLDGFEVCRHLKQNDKTRGIPVIFITAKNETENLVQGFRVGAVDYILKPFEADEVLARVETHLKIHRLTRQLTEKNRALEAEITRREKAEDALQTADAKLSILSDREAARWGLAAFVGQSRTIGKILNDVRRLTSVGTTSVLITGESGTGKELIARAIHFGSPRASGPFIPVNCVAIPSELAESMFFGHVRGAFTGATTDRKGYFELAHNGTLFLDEIGDMPQPLQAKLLRVLEDGRITPVGASRDKKVDVRILAATNADLQQKIAAGAFRQDLYFRLARFTVTVPPLRERPEDIPLLAEHFVNLFATEMGIKAPRLTEKSLTALAHHDFPGNVRELKNIIERALILSGGADIQPAHLELHEIKPDASSEKKSKTTSKLAAELPLNVDAAENLLIKRALTQTDGNIAEAARLLGIHRTRIYRKLAQGKIK